MKQGRWKQLMGTLILTLISGVMTFGCNELPEPAEEITEEIKETEVGSEEESIMIDEQYLIDNYGLTKEELEGVDVEDFIENWVKPCLVRRGSLDEETIGLMLLSYKQNMDVKKEIEEQERNKNDDYAGIFEVEWSGGYQDEYEEEITVIAVEVAVGNYEESVIFDLEQKVYYFGTLMDVSEDCSQATASGELSDEDVTRIREMLGETGVSEWEGEIGTYQSDEPDYTIFILTVCCGDETTYSYKGYYFPEKFVTFYTELKQLKGI